MKRLIILRHAKAVAKSSGNDFGRVLAERGRSDMQALSRHMADRGLSADLALVSPAARTRETWALAGFGAVPVRHVDAIYEASREDLMAVLQDLADEVGSVVLVGHNPGLEELALTLPADPGPAQAGLPTAALVEIALPIRTWRELRAGQGRIESFQTPATLEAGQHA